MNEIPLLLLASNSPRRRQLLALGGWMFGIDVADIDESVLPGETPAQYVTRLAEEKARAVLPRARAEHVIIAADTTVTIDGDILGKPASESEARSMLTRLRGRTHQVYTGIAILRASDGNLLSDLCVIDVPMRPYSDTEISAYIETGDPFDKAGAYGIQHAQFQLVNMSGMAGCFAGVMGLPLCHLTVLLRQMDIHPRANIAVNCQSTLNYQCPVSRYILRGASNEQGTE